MGNPTRFSGGLSTARSGSLMASFGMPNPLDYHVYFNDFDQFTAADWTITRVGTTPTEALTDENGGVLLLTTTAGATDSTFLQKKGESFLKTVGKSMFFQARFKASDVTLSDLVIGLQITDTTPLAVTDGIYFLKPTAAATLDFKVLGASAASTAAAVATLTAATYVTVGFHYDGRNRVSYFINDARKGSVAITNLPTTELTVSFGIQNGAAAIKTASVDYVFAAIER